jgi:hypothetical protein
MKIVQNTRALDAIKMSRKIITVFKEYGLYCPFCKGIGEETIGKIAATNGLDIKEFLKKLNAALD